MLFDREKIEEAINDLKLVKQTSYFQPSIYNSLKLAIDVLEGVSVAMKNKVDYLEYDVKIIPEEEEPKEDSK